MKYIKKTMSIQTVLFRFVLFSEDWAILHLPELVGVLPPSLIFSMTKLEFLRSGYLSKMIWLFGLIQQVFC